jgi:putative PIN family toxin of toxin-antitoxin system
MKVILDAHILISGIFFKGPPSKILDAWKKGVIRFVLSEDIIREYVRVAERISIQYEGIDIIRILELIVMNSEIHEPVDRDISICRDPSDEKFISCAIAGKTRVIISGDRHLLELNLTASAFPAACRGVSERIQMSFSIQIEDSPPLAAGSFNGYQNIEVISPAKFIQKYL